MNFSFENQGTNTYLVYTIGQNDELDTMSLGMLTNNRISGLAAALFTQMDTTRFIKYNVSAKISVKQFFSGPVNKKRLLGVFSGIVDAMLSAEEYMIDPNSILLDLEYIFADVSSCETVLICLPVLDSSMHCVDLSSFFKNVMFSTQFDQTENCDHVARIINYLNSTPVFSLNDFKALLENIKGKGYSSSVSGNQPAAPPQPMPAAPPQPVPVVPPQPMPVASPRQMPAAPQRPTVQQMVKTPHKAPPRAKPLRTPDVTNKQAADSSQEEMSILKLMMNYSKENAAIYKAQKKAKKGQPPAPPQNLPSRARQGVPTKVPSPASRNTGFAIPGQQTPFPNVQVVAPPQKTPQAGQARRPQMEQIPQPTVRERQPVTVSSYSPYTEADTTYQPPAAPPMQTESRNFGNTTVLSSVAVGETTVLNVSTQAAAPHLIREETNEKIMIDKPVYRIGKEKSYVDYFIGGNTAISRSHANIITRNSEYFVVDTNSTNHTYVNGVMIQSNVETKIEHGAKIRLANENFEFKLY